jgi:hypothetical protein
MEPLNIFEKETNQIKVVIRLRPFNQRETEDPANRRCVSIQSNGTKIMLNRGVDVKDFNFDFISNENIS